MAAAIGREDAFSGELIRLYEEGTNRPSVEARAALAKVFDRSEIYMEFGTDQTALAVRQVQPEYKLSARAMDVAKRFDQLSADCQDHVSSQIDLLAGARANRAERARAAQHDVVIKDGRRESSDKKKSRRRR